MHALVISLALIGQAGSPVPPAPTESPAAARNNLAPPAVAAPRETVQDLKNWLLTRLSVDLSFDAQKAAEVGQLIDTMNDQQIRLLVDVYKERSAKRDQPANAQPATTQREATEQQALEQAKLNLQQAEAYRDHLKREYDYRILQGYMTQNLVYQNLLNNQQIMYATGPLTFGALGYGPYGYGGLGYGGFGYGGMGYAGFGYGPMNYGYSYGAPAFGNVMYGSPYFYGNMMRGW